MQIITYKPIGIIHTPFINKESTPIQGCFCPCSQGYVEIFPEYQTGLQDLNGFSHLILLYHFHQAEGFQLLTKPFLDKEKKEYLPSAISLGQTPLDSQ